MSYRSKRVRYITVSEMNKHLTYVYKFYDIQYREKSEFETFGIKAFIEDFLVTFQLTYKKGNKACTYICRKDGTYCGQQIKGVEAFQILSKYYKVPRMDEKICKRADEGGLSASPILYYNPKYNCTRQYAYGYDMNSAYAYAMLKDIPDTSNPPRVGYVQPGEIGFVEVLNEKNSDLTSLKPIFSGFSLFVFPLIKSPFTKFVEVWYNKKKTSRGKAKDKAKNVLNFSVGYLQLVNPFIRATIIGRCNALIESLIDEDTLFCNTDSIVSLKPLNLKIGNEVGEWKLEHKGMVAYREYSYQWDDGKLSYRSIPKKWFPEGWDILKDDVPTNGNIYELIDKQLRRVKFFENL